jgi:chitin-binding protein
MSSGSYTFRYRVTAPHKGTFTVYLTKPGHDPAQPLGWDDLDLANPVATATDPVASGGFYTFTGTLPERSGRQLLYAVWQRSDSPEAFYSCSDVMFGGDAGGSSSSPAPAPSASAPSEEQIADGADRSTVEHHGHGDDDAGTSAEPVAAATENLRSTTCGRRALPGASPRRAATAVRRISRWAVPPRSRSARRSCSARRAVTSGGRHGR